MQIKIDLSGISDAFADMKDEIGEKIVAHVKNKIRRGIPPQLKEPRNDGSRGTPLFHTGAHLHRSIKYNKDKKNVEIGSSFVAAPILHRKRPFLKPDTKIVQIIKDIIISRSK